MNNHTTSYSNCVLIIGASSTIGIAIIQTILKRNKTTKIIAVSRQSCPDYLKNKSDQLYWHDFEYTSENIVNFVGWLSDIPEHFSRVIICNGILHEGFISPEKRIEELECDKFHELMHINAFIPMLWVKAVIKLLKGTEKCVLVAFSARVGSVSDNALGGWYSYRASKAALNMMLKTAAIEYARRAKNVKLIAFHPGTVKTPLSTPFRKNIPSSKIFEPTFVANQLLNIMDDIDVDGTLSYLDWDNKLIAW